MVPRREFLKGSAAALIFGAGHKGISQTLAPSSHKLVSYDERSVLVDGRRMLLVCGEIHYPRSTRAMWPGLLERSRALSLNTITTYVFWNVHETTRGVYNFTGERDLGHFLDLCQQHGLAVFLRIGPYICAEWNFGGFPPYLRDEPGITIRTMNNAYTARVEAWFERLAEVVRPRLRSNGGPVILVQVENEYANVAKRYGDAGQEYLRWIVELAKRLGFASVPSTTCEGGAQGAIETSNGFTIPPERIAAVRKSHPGTPLLWTELYPSWYRVWGGRNASARDPRSMAGGILDFISRGGSGFNYYPWHGGTNFGRTSMYLQTTSYDFCAPLDEYGEVTATGVYLGRLHAVLQDRGKLLLEGDRAEDVTGATRTTTWRSGSDELLLVQEDYQEHTAGGDFQKLLTRNLHARLLDGSGETLFDLDTARENVTRSFSESIWKPASEENPGSLEWSAWDEPFPAERHDPGMNREEPVEQLLLTKDNTDYCWYSCALQIADEGPQEIAIPYGGDFFYLYIDEQLVATSQLPLSEDRGPITPDDPLHPRIVANVSESGHANGFRHIFSLPALAAGAHRIDLLACALGMIKGDWQIASPMSFERKGIWEGVLLNGKPLGNWTMRTGLTGERLQLQSHQDTVSWGAADKMRQLRWYQTSARVPANLLSGSFPFRLDACGLGKGMMWVNGQGVGRHWLIQARDPANTFSQRYYHVPAGWLRNENRIVIFEEQRASPAMVQLQVRV